MSRPESTTDTESESTFLDSIEFLTGEDPSLGSFLLVVGMVTIVFIALFQVALPTPISTLLTVGVLSVTGLSALVAFLLENLGHFEQDTTTNTSESDDL